MQNQVRQDPGHGLALVLIVLALVCHGARAAERDAVLYLYNWNNYIAEATIERFERGCACR
ncbi:MAG: hypothetical protein EHM59_12575, partial [Betaproteobacteria bacterium]